MNTYIKNPLNPRGNISGKLIFLFIFFFQASGSLYAWESFDTEHFHFIFQPESSSAVEELVGFCEEVYQEVSGFFNNSPKKINCIIEGQSSIANGYFYPLPNSLILHVVPPSLNFLGARSESWLKLLLIHELTHYIHLAYNQGFFTGAAVLFGDSVKPGHSAFLPGWIIEGITVYLETRFSKGGRGRDPFFELYIKALIYDRALYTPAQASYNSSFPPRGRIYLAGYYYVDYLQRTFGNNCFKDIWDRFVEFPFFGPYAAIKAVCGKSLNQIHDDFVEELQNKYKKDFSISRGKLISPEAVSSNSRPLITEKGIYAYHISHENPPGIYRFDSNFESMEAVYLTRLTDSQSLDIHEKSEQAVFASYKPLYSSFFITNYSSDLYILNLSTQKARQITENFPLWQPCFHPDGDKIYAVHPQGSFSSLVEIDLATRDIKLLFKSPQSHVYTPCVSPDGRQIVFTLNQRGVQDIYSLELSCTSYPDTDENIWPEEWNNNKITALTGPDVYGDYYPRFDKNGRILFTTDRNGRLSLCRLSPAIENSQAHYEIIAQDPVGIIAGRTQGRQVIYESYNQWGFSLHSKEISIQSADDLF